VEWSTLPLTDDQRAAIVAAGHAYVGVPYSYLNYAAIAARRLRSPAARFLRRYVNSTRHLICSQLVASAYAAAGIRLGQPEPGDTTPADLASLIH
jgi:cell wall-associated NlpC family hydrolase